MKALILTEKSIVSKRNNMIKEQLIKAGYDVDQQVFTSNTPFSGCSFDFVIADEELRNKEDFKKFCKNPLDSQS